MSKYFSVISSSGFGEDGPRTKVKRYTYEENGITYNVLSFHLPQTKEMKSFHKTMREYLSDSLRGGEEDEEET